MSQIELLLVEYIFKVLVFWAVFSQWVIHIDIAIVDTDYEYHLVQSICMLMEIRIDYIELTMIIRWHFYFLHL
jgi:hypothetical protein